LSNSSSGSMPENAGPLAGWMMPGTVSPWPTTRTFAPRCRTARQRDERGEPCGVSSEAADMRDGRPCSGGPPCGSSTPHGISDTLGEGDLRRQSDHGAGSVQQEYPFPAALRLAVAACLGGGDCCARRHGPGPKGTSSNREVDAPPGAAGSAAPRRQADRSIQWPKCSQAARFQEARQVYPCRSSPWTLGSGSWTRTRARPSFGDGRPQR
jgi:hypothetical protein